MPFLQSGDSVLCKISGGLITQSDIRIYDYIAEFDVVCVCEEGYFIKVPSHVTLKTSFEVTDNKITQYSIPKNFINAEIQFITEDNVFKVSGKRDGECCDRCRDFFPMSEKNGDGKFLCFLCKKYKFR